MSRPGLFPNGNPKPDYLDHLEPDIVEGLETMIGRDPRQMTPAELNALRHTKRPLLDVIRDNCIECCAGSQAEVRRCRMHWCNMWPYRMASNPFVKRVLTDSQKQAARDRLMSARQKAPTSEDSPNE